LFVFPQTPGGCLDSGSHAPGSPPHRPALPVQRAHGGRAEFIELGPHSVCRTRNAFELHGLHGSLASGAVVAAFPEATLASTAPVAPSRSHRRRMKSIASCGSPRHARITSSGANRGPSARPLPHNTAGPTRPRRWCAVRHRQGGSCYEMEVLPRLPPPRVPLLRNSQRSTRVAVAAGG